MEECWSHKEEEAEAYNFTKTSLLHGYFHFFQIVLVVPKRIKCGLFFCLKDL